MKLCHVMASVVHNQVVTPDLQRIAFGGNVCWQKQRCRYSGSSWARARALGEAVGLLPAGFGVAAGDLAALALMRD